MSVIILGIGGVQCNLGSARSLNYEDAGITEAGERIIIEQDDQETSLELYAECQGIGPVITGTERLIRNSAAKNGANVAQKIATYRNGNEIVGYAARLWKCPGR
ncbi:MAG: hypothetical protein KDK34_08920 [Leptospiraceae bacterium]|nr:hypothetical protein [Leptospiraceae bacterium]